MEKSLELSDTSTTVSIHNIFHRIRFLTCHIGGANTKVFVDGKETCDNVARYGTKPEFVQTNNTGHHADSATSHISEIKPCHGDSLIHKEMKKGQNWNLTAYYDMNKFKGMRHADGSLEEVMGIEIMYVRRKA
jgi:hypothetical protein